MSSSRPTAEPIVVVFFVGVVDVVVGDLGGGRHKFCGTITVDRSGPFGYTVRVLPAHPELADKAELGLVTNA